MHRLNILVVEDDPIIAEDIGRYLEEFGHEVAGTAYTVSDALSLAQIHKPKLVLLDIHLTEHTDGIDLGIWFRKNMPIPLIFITAFSDSIILEMAKKVHPDSYLIKPFNKEQLKIAIDICSENYYHPDPEQQRIKRIYRFNRYLEEPLSEREVEVVRLVAEGLNNRIIANRLFVSENTIKTHLKNIFYKTSALNRTDLISRLNKA